MRDGSAVSTERERNNVLVLHSILERHVEVSTFLGCSSFQHLHCMYFQSDENTQHSLSNDAGRIGGGRGGEKEAEVRAGRKQDKQSGDFCTYIASIEHSKKGNHPAR